MGLRGRCRGVIGGAAEHVEQAAIERPIVLPAEPTKEPFRISPFEVGNAADADGLEIAGDTRAYAGDLP
jgi:hypothetical protein